MGICPFHDEKTPSFSVSEEKGLYHCFSCKASGNALTFLKDYHHLTTQEALKKLSLETGIQVDFKEHKHQRLFDTLDAAKNYFSVMLNHSKEGEKALKYLTQRPISEAVIKTFDLGFAPPSKDALNTALKNQNYLDSELIDAGLTSPNQTDQSFFKNRLIIPIKDKDGQTVGFSGRLLDGEGPKYLNSAESILFKKSELLYGYYEAIKAAKQKRRILVTEGYFDVLRAHEKGFLETVALMGTELSSHHLSLLKSLGAEIIFVLDGDMPGQKAMLEMSLKYPKEAFKFVLLKDDLDLDLFLQKHSPEFEGLIRNAFDSLSFFYHVSYKQVNPESIASIEVFKGKIFKRLKDEKPSYIDYYLKQLSKDTQIDLSIILQEFSGKVRAKSVIKSPYKVTDKYHKAEIQLLHYFFKDEHYTRWFRRTFEDVMYIDSHIRDIEFEIFEHYDLNPQTCIVYPVFKEGLSQLSKSILDQIIDLEKYPFNPDEFEDLLNVLHDYQLLKEKKQLQEKLKSTTNLEEKATIRHQIDALNKERKHGH